MRSDDSLHLLATCYYRSGRLGEAHEVLRDAAAGCAATTPQNRFLMARCCADLRRLSECEAALAPAAAETTEEGGEATAVEAFGDAAAFALRLLAGVYDATERRKGAAQAERRALGLNPLLWGAFQALCDKGERPDPTGCFSTAHLDNLDQCHGVNGILSLVNKMAVSSSPCAATAPSSMSTAQQQPLVVTVTSTPNLPSGGPAAAPQLMTPLNATPTMTEAVDTPMDTTVDTTPISTM